MGFDYMHPEENNHLFGSIVIVNIYFHFKNTYLYAYSLL